MTTKPSSLAFRSFLLATACLLAAASARAAAPAHPAPAAPPPATGAIPVPNPGPKLAGTKWEWTKLYNDDDTVLTVKDPTRYVVEFLDGGKLAIRADCNRGMGSWGGVSPSLKVEAAIATRMACPAGSLGDRFVKLLSLAESVEGDGRKLAIVLKPREGVMRLRRAGVTPAPKAPKGAKGAKE
jgi:heat shock protein HslJ